MRKNGWPSMSNVTATADSLSGFVGSNTLRRGQSIGCADTHASMWIKRQQPETDYVDVLEPPHALDDSQVKLPVLLERDVRP